MLFGFLILVQQTIHHFGIYRINNDLGLSGVFVCFRGTGTFCFSATFLGFFSTPVMDSALWFLNEHCLASYERSMVLAWRGCFGWMA